MNKVTLVISVLVRLARKYGGLRIVYEPPYAGAPEDFRRQNVRALLAAVNEDVEQLERYRVAEQAAGLGVSEEDRLEELLLDMDRVAVSVEQLLLNLNYPDPAYQLYQQIEERLLGIGQRKDVHTRSGRLETRREIADLRALVKANMTLYSPNAEHLKERLRWLDHNLDVLEDQVEQARPWAPWTKLFARFAEA